MQTNYFSLLCITIFINAVDAAENTTSHVWLTKLLISNETKSPICCQIVQKIPSYIQRKPKCPFIIYENEIVPGNNIRAEVGTDKNGHLILPIIISFALKEKVDENPKLFNQKKLDPTHACRVIIGPDNYNAFYDHVEYGISYQFKWLAVEKNIDEKSNKEKLSLKRVYYWG